MMRSKRIRKRYGFAVDFSGSQARRMAVNRKADLLDAYLCAVQAAWAWGRRNEGYGLPGPDVIDPETLTFEGWIFDPHCMG